MSTAEIIAELPRLNSAELAQIQAKLQELVDPTCSSIRDKTAHPAIGMWKDRADLPDDSIAASNLLRQRMMRRDDAGTETTQK